MNNLKIAELIKERRKALDLSQEQLARKVGCGCTAETISRIERGITSPYNKMIVPVLRYCKISEKEYKDAAIKDHELRIDVLLQQKSDLD